MRYPSPAELEKLYAEKDATVARLGSLLCIQQADLAGQHRMVRFEVACQFWAKCEQGVQAALLHDEHPHVRSAAQISAGWLPPVAPRCSCC